MLCGSRPPLPGLRRSPLSTPSSAARWPSRGRNGSRAPSRWRRRFAGRRPRRIRGRQSRRRIITRVMVLPFRMLRADPNVDFLALSLPDAIALSLAGLESLVVRSTAAAARYAAGPPDLQRIANEAEVDVLLVGSILECRRADPSKHPTPHGSPRHAAVVRHLAGDAHGRVPAAG